MTGTPATYFNEREHQICLVARMVDDARTYWVAGGGSPMAWIKARYTAWCQTR